MSDDGKAAVNFKKGRRLGKSSKCNDIQPDNIQSVSRPKRLTKRRTDYDIAAENDVLDDSFSDKDYNDVDDESSSSSESGKGSLRSMQTPPSRKFKQTTGKAGNTRSPVKWSEKEINSLQLGFERNILNSRVPRKADVERVIKKFPELKSRSWLLIKSKVQNLIKQREGIRSSLLKKAEKKGSPKKIA